MGRRRNVPRTQIFDPGDLPIDLDSPLSFSSELPSDNAPNTAFATVNDMLDADYDSPLVSVSPPTSSSPVRSDVMEGGERMDDSSLGHTRSPVLARESSTLESFSRSLRNYVPSTIAIPSVVPTPPRVSRPVSFGMIVSSLSCPAQDSAVNEGSKRRGSDNSPRWDGYGQEAINRDDPVFEDDHDRPISPRSSSGRGIITYPSTEEDDCILWSGWDTIGIGSKSQRLLLLGYRSGLQIWDCTNLGSVCEVVNISGGDSWGKVTFISVLPTPRNDEVFASQRPLIGVVSSLNEAQLIIFSLRTHEVVKKISLTGLVSFCASDKFIVISSTTPELRILSASTFALLFTVPSTSFAPFAPTAIPNFSSSTYNSNNNNHTRVSTVTTTKTSLDYDDVTTKPRPIYSLSGRFLAYASPPPLVDLAVDSRSPFSGFGVGMTITGLAHSDVGNAAMRVGGSVFSGMKTLGGMAYNAAKSRAIGADPPPQHASTPGSPTATRRVGGGLSNLFFSRSAPPAAAGHERRQSYPSGRDQKGLDEPFSPTAGGATTMMNSVLTAIPTLANVTGFTAGVGGYVTVVDLMPLLDHESSPTQPETIAEFLALKNQAISELSFSKDGTNLLVVPKDGQTCKVFAIRPTCKPLRRVFDTGGQHRSPGKVKKFTNSVETHDSNYVDQLRSLLIAGLHSGEESTLHLYDLKRGRTSAIIDGVDWSDDRRWVAIGSRKRTVHVFAVNSYGGKADEVSHLEGRVRDYVEVPSLSTEVVPIVRLREFKSPSTSDVQPSPMSFKFVKSTEATLPSNLLPAATAFGTVVSSTPPTSTSHTSSVSQPKPVSPTRLQRPKNFQDILCFDPLEGILSLHRITIERTTRERSSLQMLNSVPVTGTSISLPSSTSGVAIGKPSVSPPLNALGRRNNVSGTKPVEHLHSELVAKESAIATWHLRRSLDWAEVTQVLRDGDETTGWMVERFGKADWLSQAELWTSSYHPSVRPRSIYLWHQFMFYAFGEDYHALIRRYRLDVPGRKIEVRKEVEVSAYSTGMGESFIQGATPMDIRQTSSSFDEPLASAMSASLGEYTNPSPPKLPMLPNGAPGNRFRSPIPIRHVAAGISDGMTEGLGRLRREIVRVRSPKLRPRSEHAISSWAPLEFDEEDEDFLLTGQQQQVHGLVVLPDGDRLGADMDQISRSTSRDAASIITPSSTQQDFFEDIDQQSSVLEEDRGWSLEDRQAIEEEERFCDISAVGLVDEEQIIAPVAEVPARRAKRNVGRKGKR